MASRVMSERMVDVRKRIAARTERVGRGKRVERVSMVVEGRPELGTSSFFGVLEGRNSVVEDGCRRSFAFSLAASSVHRGPGNDLRAPV